MPSKHYQDFLKIYKGEMTQTFIYGPKLLVKLFKKATIKKLSPAVMELIYKYLQKEGLIK